MQRTLGLLIVLMLSSPVSGQQVFNLEELMEESDEHPAPHALRAQMAQNPALQTDLLAAKTEGRIKNFEDLFAATPVTLTSTGLATYVVTPSVYCPEFVGAHAISFWIMEKQPDKTYRQLLSGADDVVTVLDTQTLGYHDISTVYGVQAPSLYRFDGTAYQWISLPEADSTVPAEALNTPQEPPPNP